MRRGICEQPGCNSAFCVHSSSFFATLAFQLTVRQTTISPFHALEMEPGKFKSPSSNHPGDDTVSSLQSISMTSSTTTSRFFRIHSRSTLNITRITSLSSTMSSRRNGRAINCRRRRTTLTSSLYAALRKSSFRPLPISSMSSDFSSPCSGCCPVLRG